MANITPPFDYTSKDFLGLKSSMLEYAGIAFPDWNTSSEGDFGVMMVELFAYMGDIISYYGDRVSQEAYLPTATQRVSLLNIAELLGYVPSNGNPSTGTITFVTDDSGPPITVPAGTQLLTEYQDELDQPIVFETDENVEVPANGGTATVGITQGETQTLVSLGTSDGTAEQKILLPNLAVIDGTVKVFVETVFGKEEWTEIKFLVDADPDDKVYSVRTDAANRTYVTFGDNLNGLVPPYGLKIWATYRVGMGSKGNLPAGAVTAILSDISGVSIHLLGDGTADSTATTDGADAETNEEIRGNAPLAFRTQYRAVTTGDFRDLAIGVPGVVLANAVATHYTNVTLYIVGPNGSAPSTSLKDGVMDYFSDKTLAGVDLSVLGPTYVPVNVGATGLEVQLRVKDRYSRAAVLAAVTTALQKFFSIPNIDFAMFITVSDIYHCIMGVEGVDYVYVPMFARDDAAQTGTADIQLRESEIPIPGDIVITTSGGIG